MATLVNRRLWWATPNSQIACVVRKQNLDQSSATVLTDTGSTFEVNAYHLRPDEASAKTLSETLKSRFFLRGPNGDYITRTDIHAPASFTENRSLAYSFSNEYDDLTPDEAKALYERETGVELTIEYQWYRTDLKLGDQVEFKEPYEQEVGVVYVIVDDPTVQSVSTLRGESPARVRVTSLEMLLNPEWRIKPQQTVNLEDLKPTSTPSCQDGTCGDCPRCKGTLK